MRILPKILIVLFLLFDFALVIWMLLHGKTIAILDPKGIIASHQRDLFLLVALSGLSVVIPTLVIAFFFVFRYQESPNKRKHTPEWGSNMPLQTLFWVVPSIIVAVLVGVVWQSTHALDPYKKLESSTRPLRIQVVALQWKWLFLYPEYNIATINYIAFPQKTPLHFELTADAPMNSFWIPQLGGQIYAMEGMVTKTHLMADTTGTFQGASAEISGEGFAGMKFSAQSMTVESFEDWLMQVKQSNQVLGKQEYQKLILPSEKNPVTYYSSVESGLYNDIVMKYMKPSVSEGHQMEEMKEMHH